MFPLPPLFLACDSSATFCVEVTIPRATRPPIEIDEFPLPIPEFIPSESGGEMAAAPVFDEDVRLYRGPEGGKASRWGPPPSASRSRVKGSKKRFKKMSLTKRSSFDTYRVFIRPTEGDYFFISDRREQTKITPYQIIVEKEGEILALAKESVELTEAFSNESETLFIDYELPLDLDPGLYEGSLCLSFETCL